jgi:glycine betaine/proline transport system substrate-binding protein
LAIIVVMAVAFLPVEPSPSKSEQARGGGGSGFDAAANANKTLTLGNLGYTENIAISNLSKVLMEDELGYKEVELKTLDVGLVFEGVAGGDLDAFQDVWMPNHKQLLAQVEDDVEHLDPWYEDQATFGLAVPSYMKGVTSIADLNQSGAEEIIGIEPLVAISEQVPKHVIPDYDLQLEYVPSSTAAMLAEVKRRYNDKEDFVFPPWCPHPMCSQFDFRYLEDPKNSLGNLDEPTKISAIVNESLSDDDPVAYAFINNLRLNQDELISLEKEIEKADSPVAGAKAWLEENHDVVQPAIDAAKQAQ